MYRLSQHYSPHVCAAAGVQVTALRSLFSCLKVKYLTLAAVSGVVRVPLKSSYRRLPGLYPEAVFIYTGGGAHARRCTAQHMVCPWNNVRNS